MKQQKWKKKYDKSGFYIDILDMHLQFFRRGLKGPELVVMRGLERVLPLKTMQCQCIFWQILLLTYLLLVSSSAPRRLHIRGCQDFNQRVQDTSEQPLDSITSSLNLPAVIQCTVLICLAIPMESIVVWLLLLTAVIAQSQRKFTTAISHMIMQHLSHWTACKLWSILFIKQYIACK